MYFAIRYYTGAHARMIVPKAYEKEFHSIRSITFGQHSCAIRCLTHREHDNFIMISTQAKKQLNLPDHRMAMCHITGDEARLTVPFGVFTAGFEKEGPLLGPRSKYFEAFSDTGRELGYQALFFGHQHLATLPAYMTGYIYDRDLWRKVESPLPEVIYNRITNRKTEHHPHVVQALRTLKEKSRVFNPGFFNKATIIKYLLESSQLDHFLPKTIFNPSKQMVSEMLKQDAVYIKATHGSRGEGLCRVKRNHDGTLDVLEADARHPHRFPSTDSFFQAFFPKGSAGYLIQPQINLLETEGKPFDFRVHTNKDETGKWKLTLIAVKSGNGLNPTTHHVYGGKIYVLDEIFSESKCRQIRQRLEKTALLVSEELDKEHDYQLGELGIDMAIDQEEGLWIFEVNAKPGFHLFDHPVLKEQMPDYFSYLYRYGQYLMSRN
ncbi:YheC/YheD family endospore coat-associated protein [Thalassobacillus sp. B23F22_16]|uniref:YheC/YheD family endospore coat-associated protein n=1 Tax=Thalassobacillus sp. B23F22_16 TaxID=3459513 RepID=UPI00373E88A8